MEDTVALIDARDERAKKIDAEIAIAWLLHRPGDGCAVRLRTNSLSRLAYPRMPQRLLRKAGTAPHSGRIQRLQHMADDAIYRLAHRDAYNASFAARKTQKVKGGSNRPRRRVKLSAMHRGATPLIAGYVARHKTIR